MKRSLLIEKMRASANAAGLTCELVRQGGKHEVWKVGTVKIPVPRHREINELTARGILADIEKMKEDG